MSDLVTMHNLSTLKLKLPLEYTEAKRKVIEKALSSSKGGDVQLPEPYIKLKVKNLSSYKTFFSSTPQNYIEGVKFDPEVYVKYNLRVALHRIKTLFAILSLKMQTFNSVVFHFKYPPFSFVCMLVINMNLNYSNHICQLLLAIIITLDVNGIVNDFLILLILITIYRYPPIYEQVNEWFLKQVFTKENLNKYYEEPLVETVKQNNINQLADMNRFKQKIKDPDSLYTVLKKIKNMLASMTMTMMEVANFIEKSKNLVSWVDQTRTKYFLFAAVFAFCALNALTLRLLILCGSKFDPEATE